MMAWTIEYSDEAKNDIKALDNFQTIHVIKTIKKVSQNPLPQNEGGYGKPLGSKQSNNLTGLLKIKLLKIGIRVIYKLIRTEEIMKVIVVAARVDDEVYEIALKRMYKSNPPT